MWLALVLCLLIQKSESFGYQKMPSFYSMKRIHSARSSTSSQLSAAESTSPVAAGDSIGVVDVSLIKEGLKMPDNINGSDVRVGVIMARWNEDIITGLYKGVNESLTKCGVKGSNVFTTFVPGSFELPVTAKLLAMSKRVDVIICLGCLIKGDTMHFEYIAEATAQGIMRVSLDANIPVVFGVLTVLNKEQAIKRSVGDHNEGLSWGLTAVEMGLNRMSALGMDTKAKKAMTDTSAYVSFNSSALPRGNESANNSTKKFF